MSHQVIFYGAPGTGKSHQIKEQLKSIPASNIFRTTFHPDSDYSTFVGAYKPTRGFKPLYGLWGDKTIRLNDGKPLYEDFITYKFVSQAFLQAYIRAYKTDENVYLIIEEINRGNCAQIFGDLFQLLDRGKDGKSEYTIDADADLGQFLLEKLGEAKLNEQGFIKLCDEDSKEEIVLLSLPSNFYIYATMNTCDQSLFPIDSAFKRRWDWKYVPIRYCNEDWVIEVDGVYYFWTSFQKIVNERILEATSSEDKMLGDFFAKPDASDVEISKDTLLNKILFYLWNDVCKDGDGDIFKVSDSEEVTFSQLHTEEGKLKEMMEYLEVEIAEVVVPADSVYGTTPMFKKSRLKVTFPDGIVISNAKDIDTLKDVIIKIGPDKVADNPDIMQGSKYLVSKTEANTAGRVHGHFKDGAGNEYWVNGDSNIDTKLYHIKKIIDALGLTDVIVEKTV